MRLPKLIVVRSRPATARLATARLATRRGAHRKRTSVPLASPARGHTA